MVIMGRTINYNKLKELYNYDELINFLYNHYYYVIDKVYIRNDGIIPISTIEECYKNGITEFVSRNDTNANPSKYIHSKLISLEKSCKSKNSKKEYYELLKRAYLGDINARKKLFFSHTDKIDKRIINIYETYLEYDLISLENLGIFLYQDMWNFVNRYFNSENNGFYFSTRFSNQLNSSTSKLMRNLDKKTLNNNAKIKKKGRG